MNDADIDKINSWWGETVKQVTFFHASRARTGYETNPLLTGFRVVNNDADGITIRATFLKHGRLRPSKSQRTHTRRVKQARRK